MAAACGELVSEEEPAIDPDKVIVGQCGQDFPVSGEPGEQTSVRVIATNTNEQADAALSPRAATSSSTSPSPSHQLAAIRCRPRPRTSQL